MQISDFPTERRERDGVFKRFVRPQANGKMLSNQRSLRSSEFVSRCSARGTLSFDPNETDSEVIKGLLTYAGRYIGVGASRKMGYGRFAVTNFSPA